MRDVVHIESISDVHEIFGFEKPFHPLVSILPIDEKMTQFEYGDSSYSFGFYQISFKTGFKNSMIYGRNTYDFQEGALTFMKPSQIMKINQDDVSIEGSGWTLLFHPDLIRKSNFSNTIGDFGFFGYEVNEALHVSDKERLSLEDILEKIKVEYNQNIDRHSQELIIMNIELLIQYCKRFYERQFYTRTNLNKDLLAKFDVIINDYYTSKKQLDFGTLSVSYCAKEMGMSSNYFGDLVKNETNRSAKDHIQDYIINRAKNLLLQEKQSISEIAYDLGYEHPASFNKLFKAKTGISPSGYKNLN